MLVQSRGNCLGIGGSLMVALDASGSIVDNVGRGEKPAHFYKGIVGSNSSYCGE